MSTTQVEDRIRTVKSKIAFLGAALFPVMRDQEMRLNEEQMGGFHGMLGEIEDALGEIADAEIVTRCQSAGALDLTGTMYEAQSEHWHEIQERANEADAMMRASLAFVAEVMDRYGGIKVDRSNIYDDIADIGRVLEGVAKHTAALNKIANEYA
jgi:hypothetical protein